MSVIIVTMSDAVALVDMLPGQVGRIRRFHAGDRGYCRRLLTMGLTPGTCFTVVSLAPLGDPVCIHVRGYLLSVRQAEACLIDIERVVP